MLVIGIGNRYRSDDAVGLVVAERLCEAPMNDIEIRTESGEGTALMERWTEADEVIVIDAVSSDDTPGTLYRWEAHAEPVPARYFQYSTHAFGVPQAVELARALNMLPRRLLIYGIVGADFEAGEGLSSGVERAVDELAARIRNGIARMARGDEDGADA